jgi:hypothetical protein
MDTRFTPNVKIRKAHQNSGVHVDVYDVIDKDKSMYYDQIQEICELDFHDFKISLFCCN